MKSLLNSDTPIVQRIGILGNLMYVGLLWLVCCIPIITIGASSAAMHSVVRKVRRDEAARLTEFFRCFCKQFRRATIVWVILLLTAGVVVKFYYLLLKIEMLWLKIFLLGMFVTMLMLWVLLFVHGFTLLEESTKPIGQYLLWVLYQGLKNRRSTILGCTFGILPILSFVITPYWTLRSSFLWLFVYPGLAFYWYSGFTRGDSGKCNN